MRPTIPLAIAHFWSAFVGSQSSDPSHRFYEAFHFDDNASDADELAQLVLAGRKRATAGLALVFESTGKSIPQLGDLSVVTLFSGQPVCVIETRQVNIVPFSQVDADFAATEGEGDGSLAHWQRVHAAFFGRECVRLGCEFSANMPVVCEQFEVVYRG
ncbi:ASCH domain-containing protein [Hydrogenophaga sp.]|uniref:ASCH domain-containing protein n=1 Tax=Hydrogenophaga sp. TaxID=1904254 RepID=UPI002FC60102